jgi:hypothetical protein
MQPCFRRRAWCLCITGEERSVVDRAEASPRRSSLRAMPGAAESVAQSFASE